MKVAIATLALALAGLASGTLAQDQTASQNPPVAQVTTAKAERALIAPTVVAYGTVMMAQDSRTAISLPYAAQITRLHVSAGQTVRQGDALFAVTADPAVALATQQAQSAVTLARGERQRTSELFEQRLATRSQLATADKALADAEQALNAQRQLSAGAGRGESTVRAPYDGVVVQLTGAQGDRIASGTVVLQLARTDGAPTRMGVTLGLDPVVRRAVPLGAKVAVTSLATPAGSGAQPLAGSVNGVQTAINAQSHMIDALVEVEAPDGVALIPGEPVQGVITLAGGEHWVVPRQAVLQDDQGAYVYQVAQGHARRVPVQLRVDNGEKLGVDGPLQAGQPLVVQGNYQLADGMAVRETRP